VDALPGIDGGVEVDVASIVVGEGFTRPALHAESHRRELRPRDDVDGRTGGDQSVQPSHEPLGQLELFGERRTKGAGPVEHEW